MEEWRKTTLAEACLIRPSKREAKAKLDGQDEVSFVPMEALGIRKKIFDGTQAKPLNKVYGGYTYFADGDVLLAKITPCFQNGKLGIASGLKNGIGFGSSEFFVFRCSAQLDKEFLFYFLTQERFADEGVAQMSGAVGHQRVPLEFIERYPIFLPPLPEQERIVAILDEAFTAIATATANAEKNLANARELFDAYFLRVFTAKARQWPRRTLVELLELGWIADHMDGNHGGDYPRKHEFIDDGVPYISANCLANDAVDMEKAKYLSPKRAAKLRKGFAKSGDVLFAHNATVGPVAILDTCEETVILGTSLTYYRCNPEFIYPQYLAHYMRSSEFVRQYSLVMRQSTRNQVPITKQREFAHVVPPIDQQREIAGALDEVLKHRNTLAVVCDEKIALLAELKQSILHKAFHGELTANPKAADCVLSETDV